MAKEIVKVQLPLVVSPGAVPMALAYAEGRTKISQLPLTRTLLDLMGDRKKAYFWGRYSSLVGWALLEEAPAQDW